jgi:tellurite resistance protein
LFKDKEEVLRRSTLLRGSHIYVTEDFSRKIRKHREELLKYAREIRVRDPSARVILQVATLIVEIVFIIYLLNARVISAISMT